MWMSLSLRRKRLLRILSMRSGVPVLARAVRKFRLLALNVLVVLQ